MEITFGVLIAALALTLTTNIAFADTSRTGSSTRGRGDVIKPTWKLGIIDTIGNDVVFSQGMNLLLFKEDITITVNSK